MIALEAERINNDVCLALACYHNHPEEMREIEARHRAAYEDADRLTPKDV